MSTDHTTSTADDTTSPRRRRWGAAATVAAILIGGAVAGASPAEAFDPPSPIVPGLPPIEEPLCERTFAPPFCFPDYAAFATGQFAWDSWRQGQPAKAFYVTVRNDGFANPGEVWTTVSVDQDEIIEIEAVWGDRNVDTAPVAEFDSEALWTIRHRDGLDQDEFTTFRVWVATTDAVDLAVHTNHHAGVEFLGTPGLAGYRQPERLRANNVATAFG